MKPRLTSMALVALIASGVVSLGTTGTAYAYDSSACADGYVVPGSGNYETGNIGVGRYAYVGAQGVRDASIPSNIAFQDVCFGASTPAVNVPFIGTVGGKIVGGYGSSRIYSDPSCRTRLVAQSDGDARFQFPYQNRCF